MTIDDKARLARIGLRAGWRDARRHDAVAAVLGIAAGGSIAVIAIMALAGRMV